MSDLTINSTYLSRPTLLSHRVMHLQSHRCSATDAHNTSCGDRCGLLYSECMLSVFVAECTHTLLSALSI